MLTEGQLLGAYEIVGEIGRGGMATVYKAYHKRLDRYVALKVLHPNYRADPNFSQRFEREAHIIARLEHPNIVPIYDFNEIDQQPFIIMKLIEGRTLKQYVMKKSVDLQKITQLLLPIAEALDYAHSLGILHRDIKPSNILINHADQVFITDFGLARLAQSGESTMSADMMIGTPHYISPEQAQGDKNLTPQADLYSLGVVLYELITGTVPFVGDTPYSIVHEHIYTQPMAPGEVNPELPLALDAVIAKALHKDPNSRYASAVAMMKDYQIAIGDSVIEPRPPVSHQKASETQPIKVHRGKEVKVEHQFNMGNWDMDRIGEKFKSGADFVGNIIDEQMEKHRQPLTEEERIRKEIAKRIEERNGLIVHGAAYIIMNIIFWMIWFFISIEEGAFMIPWPFIIMAGWGIGMFAHYIDYSNKYGRGRAKREAMIEEELERSGIRSKMKNTALEDVLQDDDDYMVRLNDEGELTDSFIKENQRYR